MGIPLDDGSRIGIIGGGPAGSFFAYFLLTFARRMEMDIHVDIYEPREFNKAGPGGCNMCGGIISESLVQALAIDGIELPASVVQRGIDSYALHTSTHSVKIGTPLKEKRIAAVHRGGGPRDIREAKWGGLDGYLLSLAKELGANVVPVRVAQVARKDGKPQVVLQGETREYDLLVGATGVNMGGWKLYETLGFQPKEPKTTKTYITEIYLGYDTISRVFGNSMHLFLLDIPRLDCAAIIPKGDYLTICLLGEDIDKELIQGFFEHNAVKNCAQNWNLGVGICHCSPKINVLEAVQPFIDRAVLIGDCGATRLYKDGIGSAYRTAKAAARTAIFSGVSAEEFQKHYQPVYRAIARDNRFGLFLFGAIHLIKSVRFVLRGALKMTAREQASPGMAKRMSVVFWDMFTGSSPYRDIFWRTVDPRFLGRLLLECLLPERRKAREGA